MQITTLRPKRRLPVRPIDGSAGNHFVASMQPTIVVRHTSLLRGEWETVHLKLTICG